MYRRSFEDLSAQQVQLPRSMNGPRMQEKYNDSKISFGFEQPLIGNERRASIALTLRRDEQLVLLKGLCKVNSLHLQSAKQLKYPIVKAAYAP